MHRLEDLSFQFFQGAINGPKVYRQETLEHDGITLSLYIVGASHLAHLHTPWGTYTEAVADPSKLPPGALHKAAFQHSGHWQAEEIPYSIDWETVELSDGLLGQLQQYPLVHDFGNNALTAITWDTEKRVIETAHVYPEANSVVLTKSRLGEQR